MMQLTGLPLQKRRSRELSIDRLSNRFCLRKTRLLQRHNFHGSFNPSCFNLHRSAHYKRGSHVHVLLSAMLPSCAVRAVSACVKTVKSSASETVRSYTVGSELLELLLIEYQYKLSIFERGSSFLQLRPSLLVSDTRRMPSMNLIPVGKTTGIVISH